MRALIDGDVIRYSVGFASQKNIHSVFIKGEEENGIAASFEKKKDLNEWLKENGLEKDDVMIETRVEAEPVENCLHSVKLFIGSILDRVEADGYVIYLTGDGNFRDEIATIQPYKGNRDELHKPVHYDSITKYLLNKWNTEVINDMEADDAMSIEQTAQLADEGIPDNHYTSIICSIDKDLDMVPGWHYNWDNDEKYFISAAEGIRNFYKQLLIGDSTDNILGCGIKETLVYKSGKNKGQEYQKRVGVGAKWADQILSVCSSEEELYWAVFGAYEDRFGNDTTTPSDMSIMDILMENAYLLWMVRELDEEGKPIMWKPPGGDHAK